MRKTEVEQTKTKEMKKFIYDKLRKGATPLSLIPIVEETFDLSYSRARYLVYDCNHVIKLKSEELGKEAAEYIINNIQTTIEESYNIEDYKNVLSALSLLAKITKLTSENQVNVNINNLGFDFNLDDDENDNETEEDGETEETDGTD